ncbi:hypothetical protein WA026_009587 [Henosepilachna vigintioctopunctata]|uniref:Uncharacterized protein n=1 Tax=Henosepilachna vigintioctopunctata TaxID=420089 RepID=A0AAW1TZT7_9CUCU
MIVAGKFKKWEVENRIQPNRKGARECAISSRIEINRDCNRTYSTPNSTDFTPKFKGEFAPLEITEPCPKAAGWVGAKGK